MRVKQAAGAEAARPRLVRAGQLAELEFERIVDAVESAVDLPDADVLERTRPARAKEER